MTRLQVMLHVCITEPAAGAVHRLNVATGPPTAQRDSARQEESIGTILVLHVGVFTPE